MGRLKYKGKYVTRMILAIFLACSPALVAGAEINPNKTNTSSVYIEELTSPEIETLIKNGYTTVIIPTGGSEQNLPHMVIGKHNKIVNYTAGEIAKKLGNALVAPVIAYVPEGNINPPEGHMKFAGTISVREEVFSALLEETAASLKQHGFKLICFLGDSGGNQATQQKLADKLSAQWKENGVRVLQVADIMQIMDRTLGFLH